MEQKGERQEIHRFEKLLHQKDQQIESLKGVVAESNKRMAEFNRNTATLEA